MTYDQGKREGTKGVFHKIFSINVRMPLFSENPASISATCLERDISSFKQVYRGLLLTEGMMIQPARSPPTYGADQIKVLYRAKQGRETLDEFWSVATSATWTFYPATSGRRSLTSSPKVNAP